jgi:hypothetical protein
MKISNKKPNKSLQPITNALSVNNMERYERSIFSTTLLNNNDWLVTIGITGRFKITLKDRNLTRKASRFEGRHLVEVVKSMFNLKIIPFHLLDLIKAKSPNFLNMVKNYEFQYIMKYFTEAVFSNGGVRWQAFFEYSPNDIAKNLNVFYQINYENNMSNDKTKINKDKNFVNCSQEYELKTYRKLYSDEAVDYCCENRNNNTRTDFEKCLNKF